MYLGLCYWYQATFFLQYSSTLLQFLQCSGNMMFLQVLSRKITVGDVMDHFLWKHKDLCVCLTAVESCDHLQKELCPSVLVLLFLQGSSGYHGAPFEWPSQCLTPNPVNSVALPNAGM